MYIGCLVKYVLFLSDFKQAWIFLADFQKMSYVMKIHAVGAELLQAGR